MRLLQLLSDGQWARRLMRAKSEFLRRWARFSLAWFVLLFAFSSTLEARAESESVEATIVATETHPPISKYVYGQFIEHIANIINHGLWAEMLDDRKFYYPVLAEEPKPAPGRFGRTAARRWIAVGPGDQIDMDEANPFVGTHSPSISLNSEENRGIQQSGLAVEQGESYVGRIVLAVDGAAKASVRLVWGDGENDSQTISLDSLTDSYATYPLKYTAGADTTDAKLEITATGNGVLPVGAVSLMPADNLEGFRPEVIAQLKLLRSGVYRFPGGNFVSAHEWRDAIGEPDRRPPIMDPAWNAVQPNDVGTDEFMILCGLL